MSSTHRYQKKIQRVLHYIETHLDAVPSLDELAGIAHFSPFHFHRLFKGMVGESVASYVRRLALQRAAQRVSYSKESITTIALEAGYESLESFTRVFRATFGVSPSYYRKHGGSPAFSIKTDATRTSFSHTDQYNIPVDVRVDVIKPILVASLRHVGPYEDCGSTLAELKSMLSSAKLCVQDNVVYGVCYDDPDVTPLERCRIDICLKLPQYVDITTPELAGLLHTTRLVVQHIGNGGEYACVRVKGPYSLFHSVYRSLFGMWMPANGREPEDSPSFEAYYTDPGCTPPEELLSDLFIPLKTLK